MHINIADAFINLNENIGVCEHDTAVGFKRSNKKDILKSKKENSFNKFNQEIRKRQDKKH